MVAQEKLLTVEDLWNMPDDGKRYELIRGVIVEMAGSGGLQSAVAVRLSRHLDSYVDEHDLGFVTGADGLYQLAPNIGRIPDVGFISNKRQPPPLPRKFIPMPPDLAVEVVSPNDSAIEVREKVALFLEYGTRMVWVVYPDLERADIFAGIDEFFTITREGVLDGGDVVPGFKLPMAVLFKGLK